MDPKLIAIYLKDHLAGSMGGLELVKRAEGANEGTEFAEFLARLRADIEEDRGVLEEIAARLNVSADPLKIGAAWAAEKAGRMKLNGSLTGYSPLSRVVELEGLTVGIRGKLSLWEILQEVSADEPRLREFDFARLIERANSQLENLTAYRLRAARIAFSGDAAP